MKNIVFTDELLPGFDEIYELYINAKLIEYTENPHKLKRAYENSIRVITAWDKNTLVGILRAVGDGETVVYIQDIVIHSDYRERGIERILLQRLTDGFENVESIILTIDNDKLTKSFYENCGFVNIEKENNLAYIFKKYNSK